MSHDILSGQILGQIVIQSTSGAGTEFSDHSADGGFAHPSRLLEQTARERSHIVSRMQRVITKESDDPCECSEPATLRGKPSHCINCGGRL